jgi:hypothetical protein
MANRAKQLAKKKAKREARRREISRVQTMSTAERFRRTASAPVLDCLHFGGFKENGMGQLLFSRELRSGEIATAVFLIDCYCLGIKDAFGRVMPRSQYQEVYERCYELGNPVRLDAPTARRLVEDAVAYARSLGFEPHPDYFRAAPIFGDVDPALATRTFEFGRDGKPCFIAGPHDSPARIERIMGQLRDRRGEGGFHYLMPVSEFDLLSRGFSLAEVEEDDSEAWDDEEIS